MYHSYRITNVSHLEPKDGSKKRNVFLNEAGKLIKPGESATCARLGNGTLSLIEAKVLKMEKGQFPKAPAVPATTQAADSSPSASKAEKETTAPAEDKPAAAEAESAPAESPSAESSTTPSSETLASSETGESVTSDDNTADDAAAADESDSDQGWGSSSDDTKKSRRGRKRS